MTKKNLNDSVLILAHAMRQVFTEAIAEGLQPLREDIGDIREDIGDIRENMATKADIKTIRENMATKADIKTIRENMRNMENRLKTEIQLSQRTTDINIQSQLAESHEKTITLIKAKLRPN